MKKIKLRTLVAVCLVLALAAGALTVFSLAGNNPDVLFDYAQRKFTICGNSKDDGDGHQYPDLFNGKTKNMMPGDSVEQTITVAAKNLAGGTVTIGLHSDPYNAYTYTDNDGTVRTGQDITDSERNDYQKLLELMEKGLFTLTVEDESIGIAWTAADLAGGVSLAKFDSKRDETELKLTLSMAEDAGNDAANLHAAIGWVFTAEYIPAEPITPVGPTKPALDKGDHYAYIIGYDDGLVHPEALITRAESVTIFFRMMTEESRKAFWYQVNPYYDVFPEDWYNNAISTMTNAGIVKGYPNGNFGPKDNITRAEFATMAVRFFTEEAEDIEITEDAFPDIADSWANYEINLAYALDLVQGTPEGKFEPDREITRAEAVTIVNRVLERYPDKDHLLEDMIVWPDNMDEDMWYYADMQEATNSHEYEMAWRTVDNEKDPYEIWQKLLEVRDWAALEREWSVYNSSRNPGEVVSSRTAAVFR